MKNFWEVFGRFLGSFWENEALIDFQKMEVKMRKKSYKGRCEKRSLSKCQGICKTYDAIQAVYADILENDKTIIDFRCNVLLDHLEIGDYMTDFVCTKSNGDLMIRECVFRNHLVKPMTVKLLDASRNYWHEHGVSDWGLVIDAKE